jgi:hypothetical protein
MFAGLIIFVVDVLSSRCIIKTNEAWFFHEGNDKLLEI